MFTAKYGLLAKIKENIHNEEEKLYNLEGKKTGEIVIMNYEYHLIARNESEYKNKEINFIFDLQIFSNIYNILFPKLYNDYIHILVEYIPSFMFEYNDLGKFANEDVENNHSTAKRIALHSTNLGSCGKNAKYYTKDSTPASRKAESVLEIYYAKLLLNTFEIVTQIKNSKFDSKQKLTIGTETLSIISVDKKIQRKCN